MNLPLFNIILKPRISTLPHKNTIQMSQVLIQQFNFKSNDNVINVSIGKRIISFHLDLAEMPENEVRISEEMMKEFHLPMEAIQLHADYDKEKQILKLGPIIGLLTDIHWDHDGQPNFKSIHMFCKELHHGINESGGFFYVFSHKEFPHKGCYFKEDRWITKSLPIPDVVYNRVHSRKLEYTNSFKQFRGQLEKMGIPFFNDRFFSKWEVYEQLIKEYSLHHYIPETKLFSKESLMEFAEIYGTVFIKPIHGSQGKNIIKLEKLNSSEFLFQTSFPAESNTAEKKIHKDDLFQQIKPLLGNRIYIIQQGIPLMSYQDCPIDFRALCHKGIHNEWQVTSLVARVSSEQEFVSNISRGGKTLKPQKALLLIMSRPQALTTMNLMKELSIKTADTISKHSKGIIGELGIDIGVDMEGNLRIIEVNFKPSKNFEDGLMRIRPSAKALIQLCKMLSFNRRNEL
jgi:hypothetical protein